MEMVISMKRILFLLILFLQHVINLAGLCPQTCENEECSYNVTLKDNVKFRNIFVCCGNDEEVLTFVQTINKTFLEVSVAYSETCKNISKADIDLGYLATESIIIQSNTFTNINLNVQTQYLKRLDLSSNKLRFITSSLFNKYVDLRVLNLNRNEIFQILEGSFEGMIKLESLDLSENRLTTISNVFKPLKNLQHLNISRNKIEFIPEISFDNSLLQHLDISHNNLKKWAPGAMQSLPNLARLLLMDNPQLGIAQLNSQLLVGIGRRLQQIDVSRTGLFQIPEVFTHSVRFLSLVGNKIPRIRCGDLDSYPLLQSLDFSFNNIKMIEEDSLGRLEMLLFLNLNNNLLAAVPKSLPDGLKYLSINNNLIDNLTLSDFNTLPSLKVLLMQNNRIKHIEDNVFEDLPSLEVLDLSNNPIQMLSPSALNGLQSLRDLRLCYLNLSVPEKDVFFPLSSPESVQMLHLQSSPGLARQLLADSAALAAFSHLQYLDLRMNNLSGIRNDLLFFLVQLKTLRLHGNGINCSGELWSTGWMNWNNNSAADETCYYSTSEPKADIDKYNCTFPDTFTINDSLPPVNLYSAEIIHKLLRYYGFDTNNRTEKLFINNSSRNNMNIITQDRKMKPEKTNESVRNTNAISFNDYIPKSGIAKAHGTSKVFDQKRLQSDQLKIEHRFLDVEPYMIYPSRRPERIQNEDDGKMNKQNRSGKHLNTPVNVTTISTANLVQNSKHNETTNIPSVENFLLNYTYTATDQKSEYSPYQSTRPIYAPYLGTMIVFTLIVLALVLWASIRWRYRRRVVSHDEEQIEVANISGRVLW